MLNLSCGADGSGEVINLLRANYGRFSITICNEHGDTEWSVNCMSHRSLRALHSKYVALASLPDSKHYSFLKIPLQLVILYVSLSLSLPWCLCMSRALLLAVSARLWVFGGLVSLYSRHCWRSLTHRKRETYRVIAYVTLHWAPMVTPPAIGSTDYRIE